MMKSGLFELRAGKKFLAVTLALLSLPLAAHANSTWITSGTGDWNDPANWGGGFPTSGTTVLINNGFGPVLSSGSVAVGAIFTGSSAAGSLLINGGTLSSSSALSLGAASTGSGTLTVTGGRLSVATFILVGTSGTASMLVNGGLVTAGSSISNVGSLAGSNGSVTVTSGTYSTTGAMNIGSSGTGSLLVNGGLLSMTGSLTAGVTGTGAGTITVSSGTLSTTGNTYIGNNGNGTLQISGGSFITGAGNIGTGSGTGSATITGGTWSSTAGTFSVGGSGTARLLINGGLLTSVNAQVGGNNTPTARITSGTWSNTGTLTVYTNGRLEVAGGLYNGANLVLGSGTGVPVVSVSSGTLATSGTISFSGPSQNTLQITGGKVTSAVTIMGQAASGSNNIASITSGTWINSGTFIAGSFGSSNTLTVQGGGLLSTGVLAVGTGSTGISTWGNNNSVLVTGSNSRAQTSGALTIGAAGSGNTVTISDGALFMVGDTVNFNTNGGSGNFLRIDDGYLALFGDQANYVNNTLLTAGDIQIWNGTSWVTATSGNFEVFGYYATDSAAFAATGYNGLGGYTLIGTVAAIPEPATTALLLTAGLGYLVARRRRRATS